MGAFVLNNMNTPTRRSRRLAGKESGVDWGLSVEKGPMVNVPPPSVANSYASAARPDDPVSSYVRTRQVTTTKTTFASSNEFVAPASESQQPASVSLAASETKETVEWSTEESALEWWGNQICVLLLVLGAPVFSHVLAYITTDPTHGSVEKFVDFCQADGLFTCLHRTIINDRSLEFGPALWFLGGFNLLALALYYLPGKPAEGPITENGHVPTYTDNGMLHCVLFTLLWLVCSEEIGGGPYQLTGLWDSFPAQITLLNIFGLLFCGYLLIKGFYFPSGPDSGPSGNGPLFDYYWGGELYPRIFGIDVKVFANCRFSMTYWMLSGVSYSFASFKLHGEWDAGLVLAAISTMLYLYKFFWWEIGYMRSIDIIVDRAGFYETWGCLGWVPTVYTTHSRAAVLNPSGLSWEVAGFVFILSLMGVLCNFLADNQRQTFREANGDCLVWGAKPKFIRAFYTTQTASGTTVRRESLLLASGWWGVARHFHYFFELMAAWSWGVLSGLQNNKIGLVYPIFLTILLIHRAHRDQEKCEAKYGKYYRQYMELVPYKIIPGVY